MHHAPLPLCSWQLARDRGLYPFVVVRNYQTHSRKTPIDEASEQGRVGHAFLRACYLHRKYFPEALLVHPACHQQRHACDPSRPTDLQVGGIQVEVGVFLLLQRALSPSLLLLFEPPGDAAYGVLAHLHPAQRLGDTSYLPDRDPGEVHLEDRLFHIAGHPLVALKDLRYELALAVARYLQALDLAGRGQQVTLVVAVALSAPGGGELAVAGL